MVRPRKQRLVEERPKSDYFKPRGIPLRSLKESILSIDETEALRLADFLGMSHEEAGKKMGVSRQTFGRIIQKARFKIADAIINGKAINIEGEQAHIKENNNHCGHRNRGRRGRM